MDVWEEYGLRRIVVLSILMPTTTLSPFLCILVTHILSKEGVLSAAADKSNAKGKYKSKT